MLETLREYAREQLATSGDERLTRRAHAAYCIVLAEEGNPQLTAAEREAWLSRCDVEDDNFRAALDWLVEDGDAELGASPRAWRCSGSGSAGNISWRAGSVYSPS